MKYHEGGYQIETAKQRKERLNKIAREKELKTRQPAEIAKLYTDTLRDDGKDHTPLYTHRTQQQDTRHEKPTH